MERQNLLSKLLVSFTIGMSLFCLNKPIKAQDFYHFSASFFNPTAFLLESADNLEVFDLLAMNDDFEIITFLLKNDPTLTTLKQDQITFLAPTDRAFQALPPKIRDRLLQPQNLKKVLRYHTIARKIQDRDIELGKVNTLLGESITITDFPVGNKFGVKLNDATVSTPLPVSNGVIVPIDRVLIPPGF